MANRKLSEAEVARRLVRLRNLEKLHRISRQMRTKKDELIAAQAVQLDRFEALVARQQELIDTQAIRIAELEAMVFGKKKRPPTGGTPDPPDEHSASAKLPRTKDSYRRPIPPASAITSEVAVPLPVACVCGGGFDPAKTSTHLRYEEDIPLPELTPGYCAKQVTKYLVARGTCDQCGKHAAGRDLGGAQVALGPNVRLLAAHLISVGGMSYRQVIDLFAVLYGLTISKGEVAGILQAKHRAWLPAYNQLKADIRAAPVVHADETPWAIQELQGAGYAWVLADASGPKVCYELAQSRGAPIAKSLFGQGTRKPFAGVRITDDYGPYRNPELPGTPQLCWAHLYRAIRDTRYNDNLPEEQLPYVCRWYEAFATIYQDLKQYLREPYDGSLREQQANKLWQRVQTLANSKPGRNGEPDKLTRLKAQLQRAGEEKLFICLTKDTPCDNNRAERDLRQLVLKRKRSFGSQTERGAKALATILSVCTTAWRTQSQGYFVALAGMG